MQPVVQAVLLSWSIPPAATFAIVLMALTYLRGAWLLRRAGYRNLPDWRIASFLAGLFVLWFALASPLDTFSSFVLTAHMLQHMMLMMVAPPLLLLGEPLIPMVRGMPRFAAREFAGPFLNWRVPERIGLFLTKPVTALVLMGIVTFVWHVPGPYELAVGSSAWHWFEHACFFFVSIIFWWPVVQPWPSRAQWPRWAMVPYLVVADLQNTVLSAVLLFSDRILYRSYASVPSLFGFTPQADQAAAGATMWVVGSLVFVIPATVIALRVMTTRTTRDSQMARSAQPTALATESSVARIFGSAADKFASVSMETASFVVLFALVAIGLIALNRAVTDDGDNQVMLLSQQAGPFMVSVFGHAGEIPSGTANFAVLVQDGNDHRVLLDPQVDLFVRNSDAANIIAGNTRAIAGDENKLFFSGDVELKGEGARVLEVAVQRGAESGTVSMPIVVANAEAARGFSWLTIAIVLFAGILGFSYLWRHRARDSRRAIPQVN
jgi:cytochrome c oxidase assembly factor CtaG